MLPCSLLIFHLSPCSPEKLPMFPAVCTYPLLDSIHTDGAQLLGHCLHCLPKLRHYVRLKTVVLYPQQRLGATMIGVIDAFQ